MTGFLGFLADFGFFGAESSPILGIGEILLFIAVYPVVFRLLA